MKSFIHLFWWQSALNIWVRNPYIIHIFQLVKWSSRNKSTRDERSEERKLWINPGVLVLGFHRGFRELHSLSLADESFVNITSSRKKRFESRSRTLVIPFEFSAFFVLHIEADEERKFIVAMACTTDLRNLSMRRLWKTHLTSRKVSKRDYAVIRQTMRRYQI